MGRPDGIIFDIDGTMWDTTGILADAWNEILKEAGYESDLKPDDLKREFGKPMDVVGKNLMPGVPDDQRGALLEKCIAAEEIVVKTQQPLIYEGLAETLEQLSSLYPLFIISNGQAGYIELFLEVTGFGKYFRDYVSNGDTGLEKEDNIRLIMERNHLLDAVYVGDTAGDYESTKKAGIAFAYAGYGFGRVSVPSARCQSLFP